MAYEKQTWANGDVITAAKLNHIEDGVEVASNSGEVVAFSFYRYVDEQTGEVVDVLVGDPAPTVNDIVEALQQNKRVLVAVTDNVLGYSSGVSELISHDYEGHLSAETSNSQSVNVGTVLQTDVFIYFNDETEEYEYRVEIGCTIDTIYLSGYESGGSFTIQFDKLTASIENEIDYSDIAVIINDSSDVERVYRLSKRYSDANGLHFVFEYTEGMVDNGRPAINTALVTCTYNNGEWQVNSTSFIVHENES